MSSAVISVSRVTAAVLTWERQSWHCRNMERHSAVAAKLGSICDTRLRSLQQGTTGSGLYNKT